mmetsp:Transcript_18093/g.39578  ORF Transcript_18093/g.39578 Transcript_18093/m.39578 type:complete len:483 (-) Transcript_18093:201-1649(-)
MVRFPGEEDTNWQTSFKWVRSEKLVEARAFKTWAFPRVLLPKKMPWWRAPNFTLALGVAAQRGEPSSRFTINPATVKKHSGLKLVGLDCFGVAKLTANEPMLGCLELSPSIHISPRPKLQVDRRINLGEKGSITLRLQKHLGEWDMWREGVMPSRPGEWQLSFMWEPNPDVKGLSWHPTRVRLADSNKPWYRKQIELKQAVDLHSSRLHGTELSIIGSATLDVPWQQEFHVAGYPHRVQDYHLSAEHSELNYLKLRARGRPSHLSAAERRIMMVAGHWVDPAEEMGAPGERAFNMEVANSVTAKLQAAGWKVIRPELQAEPLKWEEYLGMVVDMTRKGVPLVEIHGQGWGAAVRGQVIGVIGQSNAVLNRELAQTQFGWWPGDWRALAVPRCGGCIIEAFNSDRILKMPKWRRHFAHQTIANRITNCVKVAARKVHVVNATRQLDRDEPPIRYGASMTGIPLRDTNEGRTKTGLTGKGGRES